MYVLQIKIEERVIKELLGFQCFVIMFLDGDCIWIIIRILQIRLHLSKKKMITQINRKTKQHSTIALDQNFATYMWCKVKTNNWELDHVQKWLLQGIRFWNSVFTCDKCCSGHKQFWEPINQENIMLKLKKDKLLDKRIVWKHLFHESLFFFVLPSIWLEKNIVIKYSLGYVGGRFTSFLEIQIHAPWPSFRDNTFVICSLVDVVVISHLHSLQQQEEKMTKP
jgi:hypothetical protein